MNILNKLFRAVANMSAKIKSTIPFSYQHEEEFESAGQDSTINSFSYPDGSLSKSIAREKTAVEKSQEKSFIQSFARKYF